MAKPNTYQLLIEKIRVEMQKGRGNGAIYQYPVELEPPFEVFTHKVQAPKSGFWSLFSGEKKTTTPVTKEAEPVASLSFININLPSEGKLNLPQFEKFILSLQLDYPLSFEIIGTEDNITIQLACQQNDIPMIIGIFQTHFPDCEAVEGSNNLQDSFQNNQPVVAAYHLKDSHFFPLNTNFKLDPYSVLLSNLNSITQGVVALQVLFTPIKNNFAHNMRTACYDEYDKRTSFFADLPDLPKLVAEKTGKPLFAISLRLIASNQQLLNQAQSFLSQYTNQNNGFTRLKGNYPINSVFQRTSCTTGMILNSNELVGLIHLPDPELNIPKLTKAKKSVAAPKQVQTTDSICLGENLHQGKTNSVFINQEWLTRHVAIFGGTGAGKTNLLSYLFQQVIQNAGCAFLDPNGDAAQEFLELIPQERINDVIYFDPLKTPLSINPLDIPNKQQLELATVNLLIALKRLFDASSWGPRLEWILRTTVKTLLLSGNKTLLDIPLIMTDSIFRQQVLSTITDKELLNFWKNVFPKFTLHALVPVLNKLSVFTDSSTIKPLISEPKPDLNFTDIINSQKIFIANLAKGTLGEKNAHILGSFIISAFQMAILGRANIPKPQRKFYTLIIDEFHNYADSSNVSSISSLLSEARKYNLSLITATQFLGQVDKRIKDAIMGNIGTLLCLRVGIDDAQTLQKELGQFTAEDLLNLNVGQAIVRMGSAQGSFNLQIPLLQKPDTDYTQEILLAQQKKNNPTVNPSPVNPTPTITIPPQSSTTTAPPSQSQTNLLPQEKDLLEFLYKTDELIPSSKIAQSMGIHPRVLGKLTDDLSRRGLVTEIKLSLTAQGRKSKIVIITSDGVTALGHTTPTGKGGAVHQHFQKIIKAHAEKQGYQVTMEKVLDEQKSVDLHLEKGGQSTAVEISITTDSVKELSNIQKCLAAGYERIIVISTDNQKSETLKKRVNNSISPKLQGKIFYPTLNNFIQYI